MSKQKLALIDGSYPNLGAGYLAKRAFVGELVGAQWIKWATVSAPAGVRASILFLVHGGQDPINEGSGLLELNFVRQVEDVSLVVCSGYIKSEFFAYVINGTSIDLYVYCQSYRDYQIAVLDELIGTKTTKNTYVTFSNVGTGSATAPSGAVYAVVRNNASTAESDGDGNQISTTYAKQTGSYPTLGAGYLAKTAAVATSTNSAQYGWWRFARLPFSTLTQITGVSSYSAILLVNSVNPAGISSTDAIQSGLIELDLRLDGGKPTNISTNAVMKVLCGGLSSDMYCCTVSDTEIEFYVYLNGGYKRRNFIVLNEVYQKGERVDALEFESTFVSSSAPTNAVYAVNRNMAAYDGDGNQISTTYAKQTGNYPNLGAGYLAKQHSLRRNTTTAGWLKIGTVPSSTFGTYVDYSCIMLIHGIFRGSLKTAAPKTAIIEIEVRKYSTSVGDQRIGIIAGDIPTDRLCYVIEDNLDMSIYLYDNYVETVNYSCEIISEYASQTGASDAVQYNVFEWGDSPAAALPSAPANAVYAVVRNIASYAESIPAASQTVLGGVKVYTDSEGYLNIDTQ